MHNEVSLEMHNQRVWAYLHYNATYIIMQLLFILIVLVRWRAMMRFRTSDAKSSEDFPGSV